MRVTGTSLGAGRQPPSHTRMAQAHWAHHTDRCWGESSAQAPITPMCPSPPCSHHPGVRPGGKTGMCQPQVLCAEAPGPATGTDQPLCQKPAGILGGRRVRVMKGQGAQPSCSNGPRGSAVSMGHCQGGDSEDAPEPRSLAPARPCPGPAVTHGRILMVTSEAVLDWHPALQRWWGAEGPGRGAGSVPSKLSPDRLPAVPKLTPKRVPSHTPSKGMKVGCPSLALPIPQVTPGNVPVPHWHPREVAQEAQRQQPNPHVDPTATLPPAAPSRLGAAGARARG